jgi:site-specific DNA-cytosine methylase
MKNKSAVKVVLDLFSGTGSATKHYRDDPRYFVVSVDIDGALLNGGDVFFKKDIFDFWKYVEVGNLDRYLDQEIDVGQGWEVVFVWASPDCKRFSMAGGSNMPDHWHHGHPLSSETFTACRNVAAALQIIEYYDPPYWALENPVGMLRKMPFMGLHPRRTVTYCQYDDSHKRMKPTDIWGMLPPTWKAKSCKQGDKCHVPAPRGSSNGTQGLPYEEKIKIPEQLVLSIKYACESENWYRLRWSMLEDWENVPQRGG